MDKLKFIMVFHNHQPAGNFDYVFEKAFNQAYKPFLDVFKNFSLKMTLHISGPLFMWLKKNRPSYIDDISMLVDKGLIEIIGSGFSEPILAVIPNKDAVQQIKFFNKILEENFNCKIYGAWLTERVWEPHLPEIFNRADIKYIIVDDYHFLRSGFRLDELDGYYISEFENKKVAIYPGSEKLRYYIPFRTVEENSIFFKEVYEKGIKTLIFADDGEKFGIWPETHKWVYEEKWLYNFFDFISNSPYIETVRLKDHFENNPPKGICYLPTTSYPELGEWALPPDASFSFKKYYDRFKNQSEFEEIKPFFQGGQWRNFLSKYRESQVIHKKMIFISEEMKDFKEDEKEPLYLAQCNDAYWHGVFGGLYLPHLRREVNTNLIKSEKKAFPDNIIKPYDFDCDNIDEIYLKNNYLSAIVDPSDGGALLSICFMPREINISDTLTRRREAYHLRLMEANNNIEGTKTIHDIFKVKEEGLHNLLVYDKYYRACGRLHLFKDIDLDRFEKMGFEPHGVAIDGYVISSTGNSKEKQEVILSNKNITKKFVFIKNSITTEISINSLQDYKVVGIEFNVNLFAPTANDRYFLFDNKKSYLSFKGEINNIVNLSIIDEWLGVKITFNSDFFRNIFIYPVYTVSLSEDGVEKTYQGSSILFFGQINNTSLNADITLTLEELK
ncbi:MAG: DUF1926 domain-containing protein [Proteobacteria bacterium]|nr:DUF1926 domain-containing protein [Pseudomonadota bacterium]